MFLSDGGLSSGSSSKEFYSLIKCIGETRSKQEEDRLLENELHRLKAIFFPPTSIAPYCDREVVVRALYCHMLGHDISSAVNLVTVISVCSCSESDWCRYAGYVLINQILQDDDDALLLLVNTIQKDLTRKASQPKMAISLNFLSQKISRDSIPLLYEIIISQLDHPSDHIKKKALNALTCLVQKLKSTEYVKFGILERLEGNDPQGGILSSGPLSRLIHSKNHTVLLAYLNLIEELYHNGLLPPTLNGADQINDQIRLLVTQAVCILKELVLQPSTGSKSDDQYHRVTSPWLQIKIMRLLVLLINKNPTLSQECYEVLRLCLITVSPNNICYALQYECILTICSMYPHPSLCRLAANVIKLFLECENRNLKLCGINGLTQLVDIDPNFIAGHELTIIDSLNDSDPTIKMKALALLTHITNTSNVLSIIDKLLATVETLPLQTTYDQRLPSTTADPFCPSTPVHSATNKVGVEKVTNGISLRRQTLIKSYQLIDRFAPSSEAYIETVIKLIKTYPKYFDEKNCLPQFVSVVSEGLGSDDEDEDRKFRSLTLGHMIDLLQSIPFKYSTVMVAVYWAISFCSYTLSSDQPSIGKSSDLLLTISDNDVAQHETSRVTALNLPTHFDRESILRLMTERLSEHHQDIEISRHKIFMIYCILQVCGQLQDSNCWEDLVEPTINVVQSFSWSTQIHDYVTEYLSARKLKCLPSIYPVMGYTEDVSRYITTESIEACIDELQIKETPEMIKQLLNDTLKLKEKPHVDTKYCELQYKPYEEKINVCPRSNKASIQQTAAEFAVKSIGSRWSLQEGLKRHDKPVPLEPEIPTLNPAPVSSASEFRFVTRNVQTSMAKSGTDSTQTIPKDLVKKQEAGRQVVTSALSFLQWLHRLTQKVKSGEDITTDILEFKDKVDADDNSITLRESALVISACLEAVEAKTRLTLRSVHELSAKVLNEHHETPITKRQRVSRSLPQHSPSSTVLKPVVWKTAQRLLSKDAPNENSVTENTDGPHVLNLQRLQQSVRALFAGSSAKEILESLGIPEDESRLVVFEDTDVIAAFEKEISGMAAPDLSSDTEEILPGTPLSGSLITPNRFLDRHQTPPTVPQTRDLSDQQSYESLIVDEPIQELDLDILRKSDRDLDERLPHMSKRRRIVRNSRKLSQAKLKRLKKHLVDVDKNTSLTDFDYQTYERLPVPLRWQNLTDAAPGISAAYFGTLPQFIYSLSLSYGNQLLRSPAAIANVSKTVDDDLRTGDLAVPKPATHSLISKEVDTTGKDMINVSASVGDGTLLSKENRMPEFVRSRLNGEWTMSSWDDLIEKADRQVAAATVYNLLVQAAAGRVIVEQTTPFGEIRVFKPD